LAWRSDRCCNRRGHPFHLLPVELAQQTTGAGTTFLRWRKHDRSAMGVALWQELMASTSTPVNLLADLHAIELQRITLNMQISLLHTLGRQAQECASKAAEAEDAYLRRLASIPPQCAIGDAPGTPARARRRRGTGISTTTEIAP
jgi:hypothetical protein